MKGDERPYLKVDVLGIELLGLLDSGSSATIIGETGFEIMKKLGFDLHPSGTSICTVANGNECMVLGSYDIPFRVVDKIVVIRTLVIPSLSHMLILGADFWRQVGLVPDLGHNHWTFSRRTCVVCLAQKPEQKAPAGLLSGRPNICKPWETISIDVVGPLPKSSSGHCYILSISDYFSKFCLFFPMRAANSKTIIKLLEDNVFLLFGVPRTVIMDNGKPFVSHDMRKLLEFYGVRAIRTPFYHSQANPCERQHRTVEVMLRSYIQNNHRHWDQVLQKAACAIRTSLHESTGKTPYFTNFGKEMCVHGKDHAILDRLPDAIPSQTLENSSEHFRKIFKDVRNRLDKAFEKGRHRYNLRHRDIQYKVGDKVWRKGHFQSKAAQYFSAKLAPRFIGPFTVHKKVSPWAYELLDGKGVGRSLEFKDLKPDTTHSNNEETSADESDGVP
ncbi:hypothetical protein JTB14_026970 [Gonioctena quinquepunctata]|nr:hypothetical protein JTB14_026970 [Gonioctena quinquepunctata]